MRDPKYLLYCTVAIIVGCALGAIWYEWCMAAGEGGGYFLGPLFLYFVDSLMFGWLPGLLFGALLHFLMQRLHWNKQWQWTLAGAALAWCLFRLGGLVVGSLVPGFDFFLLGYTLLSHVSTVTWPAAACGAIASAILWWVAKKVAPIAAPVAVS